MSPCGGGTEDERERKESFFRSFFFFSRQVSRGRLDLSWAQEGYANRGIMGADSGKKRKLLDYCPQVALRLVPHTKHRSVWKMVS